MEQTEDIIHSSIERQSRENKTFTPLFAAEQALRKQSIAAWRHPGLTIDRLAEKIIHTQLSLPEKYKLSYQVLQRTIQDLQAENFNHRKLNDVLFDCLAKSERYLLERIMDKVLFQITAPSATLENLPYYLFRYIQRGVGEYIESPPDPILHGVLIQRLLVYGFLEFNASDFSNRIDSLLQGIHCVTSLLRPRSYKYERKHVKGLLIRHLFGSACCAASLPQVKKHIEKKTGSSVVASPAFDAWDNENKVDGVVWNKASGKIMGLIQSKPGTKFLTEKEKTTAIAHVRGEYVSVADTAEDCQYSADYWIFPMNSLVHRESIERDEIESPQQYKDDLVKFINGSLGLYHFQKQSFEDDWSAIFYTSRIVLPEKKDAKRSLVNTHSLIHYTKELLKN